MQIDALNREVAPPLSKNIVYAPADKKVGDAGRNTQIDERGDTFGPKALVVIVLFETKGPLRFVVIHIRRQVDSIDAYR